MRKHISFLQESGVVLLVVDQQLDFEPGGALAVSGGDEILPQLAELMIAARHVVLTQDSHPQGHISFASSYRGRKPYEHLTMRDASGLVSDYFSQEDITKYLNSIPGQTQVLWPDHCVQGSSGWALDSRLPLHKADLILRKGVRKNCDSYSAFYENDGAPTGLSGYLRARGLSKILVTGLAGDYCVCWSALDARKDGFSVWFDPTLTRYVNFPNGSADRAVLDMKAKGVLIGEL